MEVGLLATTTVLRLTYSPKGETPGYLEWPIEGMATNEGRVMLAGLKLVLGKNAIWSSDGSSLIKILQEPRKNQNKVSTDLAGQVLGALYTLLRGFTDPADAELRAKMQDLADREPHDFYEGLLTVLLRLVLARIIRDRRAIREARKGQ